MKYENDMNMTKFWATNFVNDMFVVPGDAWCYPPGHAGHCQQKNRKNWHKLDAMKRIQLQPFFLFFTQTFYFGFNLNLILPRAFHGFDKT